MKWKIKKILKLKTTVIVTIIQVSLEKSIDSK